MVNRLRDRSDVGDQVDSYFSATWGTITVASWYTIHTFTASWDFTINSTVVAQLLVVAGGWSGGYSNWWGGWAGGAISNWSYTISPWTYSVVVWLWWTWSWANGQNSVFNDQTAIGWWWGGCVWPLVWVLGGSWWWWPNWSTGGSGTASQWYAWWSGWWASQYPWGGGWWYSAVWANAAWSTAWNWGAWIANPITWSVSGQNVAWTYYFAWWWWWGVYASGTKWTWGNWWWWAGGKWNPAAWTAGTANTWWGGWGSWGYIAWAAGGSGIVIIAYPTL